MEDSYQEWLAHARHSFSMLISQSMDVRKVVIDVEELLLWCQSKNLPVNGTSRSQYASETFFREHKPES